MNFRRIPLQIRAAFIPFLLTSALFTALLNPAQADSPAGPKITPADIEAVLLVGNSFTFYNNGIHSHLRQMLLETESEREPQRFLKSLTLSGGRLQDHRSGLEQTLSQWDWSVVILQGHSLEAYDEGQRKAFHQAADELAARARHHGAEPVLFMTWAYRGRQGMIDTISREYLKAGQRNGMAVIPVGLAFSEAIRHVPEENLIMDDEKHPTMAGTYLAACTLYASLFNRSPEGLGYTAGLPGELAVTLQQSAWRALQNHTRTEP